MTANGRDPERFYTGTIREPGNWSVTITERGKTRGLPTRHNVRNHSPNGFAWGYGGSGPAQLALAILIDVIGKERAMRNGLYHRFKFDRIATLDQDKGWTMTASDVRVWADDHGGVL